MRVGKRRMELLEKSTSAENSLGDILERIGLKFIRQYPIWTGRKQYYADIYVPSLRLVIEVDGNYHFNKEQKRKDENRSAGIRRLGYYVCRFTNKDARNPFKVATKISRYKKEKFRNNVIMKKQ